jgi:hypothetical protein
VVIWESEGEGKTWEKMIPEKVKPGNNRMPKLLSERQKQQMKWQWSHMPDKWSNRHEPVHHGENEESRRCRHSKAE